MIFSIYALQVGNAQLIFMINSAYFTILALSSLFWNWEYYNNISSKYEDRVDNIETLTKSIRIYNKEMKEIRDGQKIT